jgi:hypothetical protein
MNELQRLQHWYTSQCNEDWEHSFGVKIETLDNPGWWLEVDLRETDLSGKEFNTISRGDSEDDVDWIHCKVESDKFVGSGGASNLAELLQHFLAWAGR